MAEHTALSSADLKDILNVPDGVWEALRDARIFITGGTGFFGHALLEAFLHANAEKNLNASLVILSRDPVSFLARFPHYTAHSALHFHTGDVRDFYFPEGTFTHVIHAATEAGGAHKQHSELHMADTILQGTRHVLEFATVHNARMLYISSGAVYGRARATLMPIPETDTHASPVTEPSIAYDESKRMAEALCVLFHRSHHLPVTIARGFSFVGPHLPLNEHFAIGNFIRDALAGKTIEVNSDGRSVRSYLYSSDLGRWLWTMLVKGQPATAYNLGADVEVSIGELARQVQHVVNPSGAVDIKGVAVSGAAISYQVPDITRAATELGLRPLVSLEEAIRRTAEWYRTHPVVPTAPSRVSIESLLAAPDVIVFDFDGVMTDNRVAVLQDGREAVFCDRSDGLGIGMLKKLGVPMLVLSTETNPVVAARCKKLGLECLQGIDMKEVALAEWLKKNGYEPANTIYLGNDINDLGCLKLVGLPAVVGDAYPEAKAVARLVLSKHGGKGAVRELVDRVIRAASLNKR